MKKLRVIPRLDIKGPNLVKGIHLEGLRVLGKPETYATAYYEQGADELFFMDVVASLFGRNSLHEIISNACKNIFIPITVGGGIRTLDDIRMILRSGADKVAINTAAVKRAEFIAEAAREFGSSTVVGVIEAIKQSNGKYEIFTDNGREYTGIDAVTWSRRLEELGAGEIIVTSVDRDGTGQGFDLELVKMLSDGLSVPVIAHGGASSEEDVVKVARNSMVSAIAVASCLHYSQRSRLDLRSESSKSTEGNFDFINRSSGFSTIKGATIEKIKGRLHHEGFEVRQVSDLT